MAERPTFASVTDAACKCGYLRGAADDPRQPIVFDKPTGEYHFQYREAGEDGEDGTAYLVIYHCPFCGGAAPKSKRASLFHVIPLGEEERLTKMLSGITSLRSAVRKLGRPDDDNPLGTRIEMPARAGRAPTMQWFRTLHYGQLSKVADVCFTERADGRATWRLHGKAKKLRRSESRE